MEVEVLPKKDINVPFLTTGPGEYQAVGFATFSTRLLDLKRKRFLSVQC